MKQEISTNEANCVHDIKNIPGAKGESDTLLFVTWYFPLARIILESIALVALGTGLIRERYSCWQIAAAGTGVGITNFLIQQLPIKYGVHMPLGIIVFILTLTLFLKLKLLKSAAAVLLSFVILILIEALMMFLIINIMGYAEETVVQGSDLNKFLFSLPPLVLFMLLAGGMQAWLRMKRRVAVNC